MACWGSVRLIFYAQENIFYYFSPSSFLAVQVCVWQHTKLNCINILTSRREAILFFWPLLNISTTKHRNFHTKFNDLSQWTAAEALQNLWREVKQCQRKEDSISPFLPGPHSGSEHFCWSLHRSQSIAELSDTCTYYFPNKQIVKKKKKILAARLKKINK